MRSEFPRGGLPERLCLVRHGATVIQAERRYCGNADSPLTAEGVAQMCRLQPMLRALAGVRFVSSDLGRARASAELLAEGAAVAILPRLREIAFGAWEGRRFDEIPGADAEQLRSLDFQFPGGESARMMMDRVAEAIPQVLNDPGQVTVVVAHAGSLAALFLALTREPGLWWNHLLAPGGVAWLRRSGKGWRRV